MPARRFETVEMGAASPSYTSYKISGRQRPSHRKNCSYAHTCYSRSQSLRDLSLILRYEICIACLGECVLIVKLQVPACNPEPVHEHPRLHAVRNRTHCRDSCK